MGKRKKGLTSVLPQNTENGYYWTAHILTKSGAEKITVYKDPNAVPKPKHDENVKVIRLNKVDHDKVVNSKTDTVELPAKNYPGLF